MISWKFVSAVSVAVVLAAAVTVPWAHQSQTIAPTTDASALVATARLEERVQALYRLMDEREKQVDVAQRAAKEATDKAAEAQQLINVAGNEWRGALDDAMNKNASKSELTLLVDRVVALETGAAGGVGRSGGTSSSRELTLAIIPIGFSLVSLLVVLFLAFGRRQVPKSPAVD